MIRRNCRLGLLCVGLAMTFSASAAVAQVSPVPDAVPAFKPILFEVVSIRPFKGSVTHSKGFTDDGFSDGGQTPKGLIQEICEPCKTIEGLPDWAKFEEYSIEARVADGDVARWKTLSFMQRQLAIQAVLEDRFKLKFHRETRMMSGYALVVAKNGPKFKESVPGDLYADGFKNKNGKPWLGIVAAGPLEVIAQHTSMEELAVWLMSPTGRPVADQTGLKGFYDFKIKIEAPDPSQGENSAGIDIESSVFNAIQVQLGLKLESGVKVPFESLVIDHIERPSEN